MPGIEDVFTLPGVAASFTREGETVDGFVLDARRVKGIRFVRE